MVLHQVEYPRRVLFFMGNQMKAILGKKLTMSQTVTADGRRVPVTRIKAGPVTVTQIKSVGSDGYDAVQLGFGLGKKLSKPLLGHLKTSSATPAIFKEIRLEKAEEISVGDKISVADVFSQGEVVDVTATSKGKGFAGGIKRHHFSGGPKTHGQSDRHRAPGSIGSTTTPGRVLRGKHMAGRMGGTQATTQGLEVMAVNADEGILVVKGAVPGPTGGVVLITKSDKKLKIYHGPQAQALPHGDEAPVESEVVAAGGEAPAAPAPEKPAPPSEGGA